MRRQVSTAIWVCLLALGLSGLALAHEHSEADARQYGYVHGYRDGFDHGRLDRSRHAGYDFHSQDYRRADDGYEPYMGERDDFRKGYQEGYRTGYDDGFYARQARFDQTYSARRDDYPSRPDRDDREGIYATRGYDASNVASEIGYRDGLEAARNDLQKHKGFRPEKHDTYEDASHGYRDAYGDKNEFKRHYRQGYLRGYEDGYGGLP